MRRRTFLGAIAAAVGLPLSLSSITHLGKHREKRQEDYPTLEDCKARAPNGYHWDSVRSVWIGDDLVWTNGECNGPPILSSHEVVQWARQADLERHL